MNGAKIEALGEGRFRVHGALAFRTVARLLKESRKRFSEQKRLLIDLSNVTESDSAGLALLLEWLRMARDAKQEVWFSAIPAPVSALSRIGEVDDLLQAHESEGDSWPATPVVVEVPVSHPPPLAVNSPV